MGTLTSAIAPIMQIGSAINSAAGFAKTFVGASQDRAESDLKYQQSQQDAALQRQKNLVDLRNSETDRQAKLRKLVASQRAYYGGKGIGSGPGSSEAVLQGLFEGSDIDRQQNQTAYDLQNSAINQRLSQQKQINLLQKEQLREKTALSALTDLF